MPSQIDVDKIRHTNGTDALTFDTSGNTNLKSAIIEGSSSGNLVRITQTGTGNALVVEDSANPDSTPLVVDSSGKLLLGMPSAITTIFGQTPQNLGVAGPPAPQVIGAYGNNQFGPRIDLIKSRSATINGQTVLQDNDGLGEIYFGGSDGTSMIPAARILAQVDGTPGTNDMPGSLAFSTTADGASSLTERMRIDSSGVVSINTGYVTLNNNKVGGIQVTIADDAYAEITPPRIGAHFITIIEGGDETFPNSNCYCFVWTDFGNSAAVAEISVGPAFETSTSGPPTGTTGTDVHATLFVGGTSGKIYLENRMGQTGVFQITFL